MTKDEIIEQLFNMLDQLSFSGAMLDEEEEQINTLYDEYHKIKATESKK